MQIQLAALSLVSGQSIEISLSALPVGEMNQVQVEVLQVGVLNPQLARAHGSSVPATGNMEVKLDSTGLQAGMYEVRAAVVNVEPNGSAKVLDGVPGVTVDRLIFEIAVNPRAIDRQQLLLELRAIEEGIEYNFLEPVDALHGAAQPASRLFVVFVFVRGMLLGMRMRFPRFEVMPGGEGISDRESLDKVNAFLQSSTKTGVHFPYSDQRAAHAKQASPVAVFHFPAIRAPSFEAARAYADAKADQTLLALALKRDASGEIFDTVVIEPAANMTATSYARTRPYRGNLIRGWLAGEDPSGVEAFADQIGRSSADRLLTDLYKEARREPSPDFQYVRLWAILEALADAREYDPGAPLLDFEGNQVSDGTKLLTVGGSAVHAVYALLREVGMGNSERNWKRINAWFGFRTATAHHGSREKFSLLVRPTVRTLTEQAWQEIAVANGHDSYLWELKEDVKLLLMRRLNRASPWD